MTIYSIRTSLGRELWWTAGRAKAFAIADQITGPGDYIQPSGVVGHSTEKGVSAVDLPVAVYKCSVAASRRARVPA